MVGSAPRFNALLISWSRKMVSSYRSGKLIGSWSRFHSDVGNRLQVSVAIASDGCRRHPFDFGGALLQCWTYTALSFLVGLRMDLTLTLAIDLALTLTLTGMSDRKRLFPTLTGRGTGATTLAGLRVAATAARWAGVCRTGFGLATMAWVSEKAR